VRGTRRGEKAFIDRLFGERKRIIQDNRRKNLLTFKGLGPKEGAKSWGKGDLSTIGRLPWGGGAKRYKVNLGWGRSEKMGTRRRKALKKKRQGGGRVPREV